MFCQFLLHSKVTQLYMYNFTHIILHPVPSQVIGYSSCAIERDLIAYPLQMQEFASTNPKLPVHPIPSLSPPTNTICLSSP